MPYIPHCDICDKRIEDGEQYHSWAFGEIEVTSTPYSVVMMLCDSCAPLVKEELESMKKRIKQWQEQARNV